MAFRVGRAAIGAVLAAGLGLAGLGCSRDDASAAGAGNPKGRQGAGSKGVEFTHDTAFQRIRIEAEAANAIESDDALPPVGGKVMRVVDDPTASGGKCVWIPDKAGTPEPDPKSGVPPKFARAVYKFKIAVPGNYTFWVRRKWQDSCGDTLYVRFNKQGARHTEAFICGSDDSSEVPKWGWSPVWEEGQPKQFFLSAGEHTLEVLNREDGPRFDVILLTDDPGYLPQGMED